jgi:hypothetical protein
MATKSDVRNKRVLHINQIYSFEGKIALEKNILQIPSNHASPFVGIKQIQVIFGLPLRARSLENRPMTLDKWSYTPVGESRQTKPVD